MKPFELIDHTADIGLKVTAKTLKELFENAAKGMFYIIAKDADKSNLANLTRLEKKIELKKNVEAFEELLVAYLSELLYIFNKEKIYFSDFKILELNNNGIVSEVSGVKIGPSQHTLCKEIKAVTFHNLKIEEEVWGFNCAIIFDV